MLSQWKTISLSLISHMVWTSMGNGVTEAEGEVSATRSQQGEARGNLERKAVVGASENL